MILNCITCGKELDCSKEDECFSDNPNALTHPHLGGIQCRHCYSQWHPFCSKCDIALSEEWSYCPWCGAPIAPKKESR